MTQSFASDTPIHRLIYYSRPRAPKDGRVGKMLREILAVSAERNGLHGITGALLLCGGWFMQALEGEHKAVDDLYRKISVDPRHQGLRVITNERATGREFGEWSMCGRELLLTDEAIVAALETRTTLRRLTGGSALSILMRARDLQMRDSELVLVERSLRYQISRQHFVVLPSPITSYCFRVRTVRGRTASRGCGPCR